MIHRFCKVFVYYIVSKQLAETFISIFRRFLPHELIIFIINSCLCLSVVFIAKPVNFLSASLSWQEFQEV